MKNRKLIEWLDKKYLSVETFAWTIGVCSTTVFNWRNGLCGVSRKTQKNIAAKFPDCPLLKK